METHPTACLWGVTAPNLGLCAVCVCLVAQLCLNLQSPGLYSPLGYSVHGILQARILEWVAMPSSRGSRFAESVC